MGLIRRRNFLLAGGGAAALLAAGVEVSPRPAAAHGDREPGDVILGWNRALLRIVRTVGAQPATVHPTRSFAMLHAAMYDAVVSVTGTARPYLFKVNATRNASPVAAAAQAGHDVLAALYPAQRADVDAQLADDLAAVPERERGTGVAAGGLVARLMLALRTADGSSATPPALPPGVLPGQYRPTPPGFAPAVFTHWPAVAPFLLDRADQFRPAAYPDLAGPAYKHAIAEVTSLGRDTSTTRTADQTTQARFWAAPIWNYWNEIGQTVLSGRSGLTTTAQAFAVLNLALADAAIAFYEAKYHYLIWRPVTAIQLDPAWNPLATTPADPSYPGAHSVVAQAAAAILGRYAGPVPRFAVTSEALPGVTRTFTRLQDAADEAGLSRIYAGVHTRLDHVAGQRLGLDIGRFAAV
jgi:hypothetical protein